jgi:hypothetical protein
LSCYAQAPQLRHHCAPCSRNNPGPRLRSKIAIEPKSSITSDNLLLLFTQLFDDDQVFLLRLTNIVHDLQRLIEKDDQQGARISQWVAEVFSDLALIAQVMHQIDIFFPWSAGSQDTIDLSKDDRQERYNKDTAVLRKLSKVVSKCPSLADVATPISQIFAYPASRRRNEANTKAMQQAEQNLDEFWIKVDNHYQSETGKTLLDLLHAHGVEQRDMERTTDWTAPVPSREAVTNRTSDRSDLPYLNLRTGACAGTTATPAAEGEAKDKGHSRSYQSYS